MRVGIFGGTFDPVHYGHLLLAEQCREQCVLDEVRIIPAGLPPHKTENDISPAKARVEMLQLAIGGHESFRIDEREILRTGPSFTYETLEELQKEEPDRRLFLIIGADSLYDFPTWRKPERIMELAELIVVNRGDQPPPELDAFKAKLGDAAAERVNLVQMPGIGLSSTDIRNRVAAGKSVRYMTPRAVECFIAAQQLYHSKP